MHDAKIVAFLTALSVSVAAHAEPSGKYAVVGKDPGSNAEYRGTVEVARRSGFYDVTWTIAGDVQKGIGLGSGDGPDGPTHLSVAYGSGSGYGIAEYSRQPDGSWRGTWMFQGGAQVSTEDWLVGESKVTNRDLSKSPKPVNQQGGAP